MNPTTESSAKRVSWELIESALDLPERIELFRRCPDAFKPDPERAEVLLRRWRSMLGRDDAQTMDDRLAQLGVAPSEFASVVGCIDASAATDLPAATWMPPLEDVLAWDGACDEDGLPKAEYLSIGEEKPIPFEHALVPWVDIATDRLRARMPDLDDRLGAEVLGAQQRRLLEDLAKVGRFAGIAALEQNRLGLYDGNDFALGMLAATPPRVAYARAVREMVGREAMAWAKRYPALARLLAVRVNAWVRGLGEFLDRLEEDRSILEETFGGGNAIGALSKLAFGSGDSHNGGRSVAVCTFDSGVRVVYKPRSCRVDTAFAEIVESANAMLPDDLRLRTPRTVDRGRWGWAEFIESAPGVDLDDLRRYARRMGSLLALIHLLQGNDFHLENVMAVGGSPVPIDLETVCVPEPLVEDLDMSLDPVAELVSHSVLRTLLLPQVMGYRGAGRIGNLGAARLEVEQRSISTVWELTRVNTDFQRWVRSKPTEVKRPESESWIEDGEMLESEEQMRLTQKGYRAAYEAFLRHRSIWTGDGSPIRRLDDALVRVLNRATNIYVRLIQQSCEAEHLVSGVDRWLVLDRASLGTAPNDDREAMQTPRILVRAESESMRDGDVAYFVARGRGTTYWTIDPATAEAVELAGTRLDRSAVDLALAQVERMGEDDLALQMTLQGDAYRTAFASLEQTLHGGGTRGVGTADAEGVPERPLRDVLIDVLDGLLDQGIAFEDGVNWIDVSFDPGQGVVRPSALSTDLYSGLGGVALVFERAYRSLGDRRYLEAAERCLRREHENWQRSPAARDRWIRSTPEGVGTRAGVVAGWWALGRHEEHGTYREAARELATSLTDRTIGNDHGYDVIAGSAGYILLLLRLAKEEPISGLGEVISRLADHLVASASTMDGPGWKGTSRQLPLCGFGHGRAGIGLALLEAGALLDRRDLRTFAERVFEAEHRLRGDEPAKGWPDYRGVAPADRSSAIMGSPQWCSGTEGIALSRAAALHLSDQAFLRDDLDFALETVRRPKTGRGHLCCGIAGGVLARRSLAHLSAEAPMSRADAERVIGSLLQRHLDGEGAGTLGLGLFQGIAGIAWAGLSILDDDGSDLLLLGPGPGV